MVTHVKEREKVEKPTVFSCVLQTIGRRLGIQITSVQSIQSTK